MSKLRSKVDDQDDSTDCVACHDLNDLMKVAKSTVGQSNQVRGTTHTGKSECPLSRTELGNATWSFLHSVSAYYPEKPTEQQQANARALVDSVSNLYPCRVCAAHFRETVAEKPPQVASRRSFAEWMCEQHNFVNAKLGKPKFDCTFELLDQRWRRGYADGRCPSVPSNKV